MGTHNSNLNNFFSHLQKFLRSAPLKITEAFWNDLKEKFNKSFNDKDVFILQRFFNDWNDVILFICEEGGCEMSEQELRSQIEKETSNHYSKEILEKIKMVEKYWTKEDSAPLILKYSTSAYLEDYLCRP